MTAPKPHAIAELPALAGCAIWTVELDRAASQDALATLSDDELARMGRFVFERDRGRFAAGRSALRYLLGEVLERDPASLRFTTGPYGKPWLGDDPGLAFNLSHSAGSAIIAIDHERRHKTIGVDLELRREVSDAMALAQSCFDAGELDALAACGAAARDDAFLQGWTRKEACLKAGGAGFSSEVIPSTGIDASPRRVVLHGGTRAWLQSLLFPDAIAALAVVEHREADAAGRQAAPRQESL